jgi:hypothetical protein
MLESLFGMKNTNPNDYESVPDVNCVDGTIGTPRSPSLTNFYLGKFVLSSCQESIALAKSDQKDDAEFATCACSP